MGSGIRRTDQALASPTDGWMHGFRRQNATSIASKKEHLQVTCIQCNRTQGSVLQEITGQRRNRIFRYRQLLALFQDDEGPTPTGLIVIERLRLSELLPETNELVARRAWLRAFDRATRTGGYLVGDGTDRGERARPEDRARLGGRGPDGLPTGLRRCPLCRQAAGDYLRGGVEIVRVYCACENHNRCAGCLTPLAAHRLSAWFWGDADGRAWHLAAYAAFSHRCPASG